MAVIEVKTVTIIYKCGCKKTLSKWGEVEAPLTCPEHVEVVQKIVRETEFVEFDSNVLCEG